MSVVLFWSQDPRRQQRARQGLLLALPPWSQKHLPCVSPLWGKLVELPDFFPITSLHCLEMGSPLWFHITSLDPWMEWALRSDDMWWPLFSSVSINGLFTLFNPFSHFVGKCFSDFTLPSHAFVLEISPWFPFSYPQVNDLKNTKDCLSPLF